MQYLWKMLRIVRLKAVHATFFVSEILKRWIFSSKIASYNSDAWVAEYSAVTPSNLAFRGLVTNPHFCVGIEPTYPRGITIQNQTWIVCTCRVKFAMNKIPFPFIINSIKQCQITSRTEWVEAGQFAKGTPESCVCTFLPCCVSEILKR